MLKYSEGFVLIFVHYLFFNMGQVKLSMDKSVPYGNLLVPGQVYTFAISTPLCSTCIWKKGKLA